jgi:hypothetical protein
VAFTPPAIEPVDLVSSEAAIALKHLCARGACESTVNTSRWVLELLHMHQRGEVTLRAAVFIVRHILTTVGGHPPAHLWANAAAVEVLGQVDTLPLTPELLRKLISAAYSMHLGSFGGNIRTQQTLAGVARSHRAAAAPLAAPPRDGYLAWFDRVVEALSPYLVP